MQLDTVDIQARHSVPTMLEIISKNKLDAFERFNELKKHDKIGEDAKKLLQDFDFNMSAESAAAAVFHEWEH